ncbi:MAG: autotransporter domain-containing protein [Methyloceanibacter sp.]
MDYRGLGSFWAYRALPIPGVTAAALLAFASPASASEMCPIGAPGVAVCGASPDLVQDISRSRVNRTLATNPTGERLGRLDAAGASGSSAPFAMTPDGNNTNFNTSLTQWSAALTEAELERLKQAKDASGDNLALPKTVKSAPPKFDMWAKGRRESFSDGAAAKEGDALTTYVGADYRMSRDFLFGGLVQFDEASQSFVTGPEAIGGKAYMAGPYMAYRLTPNVVLDAKAAWGTAQDSAMVGAESARFATGRVLTEAKVKGSWDINQWQLSQSGAVTYFDETSHAGIGGIPGASVDVTRLSVGPELKRQFDIGTGASVEPFAFVKSSLDLGNAALSDPVTHNTVGAGVMLAKPENFNIRATADYTESNHSDIGPEARGKVSVSVPSSLFGF